MHGTWPPSRVAVDLARVLRVSNHGTGIAPQTRYETTDPASFASHTELSESSSALRAVRCEQKR